MSNTVKNFILFIICTCIMVFTFFLASLLIDIMATPQEATQTAYYGISNTTSAVVLISVYLFACVVAIGVLISSRLKPIQ